MQTNPEIRLFKIIKSGTRFRTWVAHSGPKPGSTFDLARPSSGLHLKYEFKATFHASLIQAGMKLTLNLRYRTREVIKLGKTYRTSLSQRGAKVFPDLNDGPTDASLHYFKF